MKISELNSLNSNQINSLDNISIVVNHKRDGEDPITATISIDELFSELKERRGDLVFTDGSGILSTNAGTIEDIARLGDLQSFLPSDEIADMIESAAIDTSNFVTLNESGELVQNNSTVFNPNLNYVYYEDDCLYFISPYGGSIVLDLNYLLQKDFYNDDIKTVMGSSTIIEHYSKLVRYDACAAGQELSTLDGSVIEL